MPDNGGLAQVWFMHHSPALRPSVVQLNGNPGRFVMRRLVAAVALAFPVCASADFVRVEYSGVVQRLVSGTPSSTGFARDNPDFTNYSRGDRISGFMMIDLAAAPPDSRPRQRGLGVYPAPPTSSGYISGTGGPMIHAFGVLVDEVSVRDSSEDNRFEHYRVTDNFTTSTTYGYGQLALNVNSRRAGLDLVKGDGIAQTFDATSGHGLEMTGHLRKRVSAPQGSASVLFSLLFDRIKVTAPGQCKR
jgi:hypothetical protein